MQRIQHNGLVWYTFDGPSRLFHHALITRQGGVSRPPFASLNLGHTVGDAAAAVVENHRRIFDALGLVAEQVVSPHQVHGREVARVTTGDGGRVIPATDGLITNTPGLALLLRFADCTPVLFYDPEHQAVGLAHAGWRGVACGVISATMQAMTDAFGTRPSHLWAGIGPTIGPDHYEVGAEVIAAVQASAPMVAAQHGTAVAAQHGTAVAAQHGTAVAAQHGTAVAAQHGTAVAAQHGTAVAAQHDGRWFLNMPAAIEAQLAELGVTHIEQAEMCTAGCTDEWYSHRQEKGRTGRFGVMVRLVP